MDGQQPGLSSAGDHQNLHIRQSASPSPQVDFSSNFDPNNQTDPQSYSSPGNNNSFSAQGSPSPAHSPFDISNQYLAGTAQQFSPSGNSVGDNYLQAQSLQAQRTPSPQFNSSANQFTSTELLDVGIGEDQFFQEATNSNTAVDSLYLDPQLLESVDQQQQQQQQSIDPSALLATASTHSPTPPHLLSPGIAQHSNNASQSSLGQNAFPSPQLDRPNHSRHTSLDPSSAAFPQLGQGQGNEWGNIAFRGHRRAPSDTYSDVSSSAQPSPFLGNNDSFDQDNPSPLLGAQQDPAMYSEVMSFGQFSLSEPGPAHYTPAHSPHISPRLLPQQHSLPPFTADNNYGMIGALPNSYRNMGAGGIPNFGPGAFLQAQHQTDFGAADQMSPPEINIDFAPPSRQASFGPPKAEPHEGALSPPDRTGRGRNRVRAKSDPFSGGNSRSSTPGSARSEASSLSPNVARGSRSTSPGINKSPRRSSTSSVPNRDYILDLADPTRPASNASGDQTNGSKRTQKHPATFQCHLCPKRFTRAYNLRSHLRTHTDERPFVCSVCGKAFARQHDRKRHEGLHSGEKKFVCRGVLKDGNNWGCGRRFARADALGRHFRSEAGRVCIRPLLEEEAAEKGLEAQQAMNGANNGMMQGMAAGMAGVAPGMQPFPAAQGFNNNFGMMNPSSQTAYALPAALLAQFPALAGIQWDTLPPGPPDEMEGDLSGRSSFDASSGGEYYDDEDLSNASWDNGEGSSKISQF